MMNGLPGTYAQMVWDQTWQVTLLITAVCLATRLLRIQPHLAHVLWVVVLLKCVTPPLWSSPSGVFSWLQVAAQRNGKPLSGQSEHRPTSTALEKAESALFTPAQSHVADMPIGGWTRPDGNRNPADPVDATYNDDGSTSVFVASTGPSLIEPGGDRFNGWTAIWIGWLVAAFGVVGIAGVRCARCLVWARRGRQAVDPALDSLLRDLMRRLRIRQRVRLLVTDRLVGPAVVGVMRPTVILPSVVVERKSDGQLEPILAHELIHVRRGDLWIGLLQVTAQSLWWFHPLIWLANRWMTREAERCCDEEVLAELGCKPSRYAGSLLEIVELKRKLTPVPSFPGVRPVDITAKRLERIMTLGHGCRKRTPWWCWVVMVMTSVIVLPGAVHVMAAGEADSDPAIGNKQADEPIDTDAPSAVNRADQAQENLSHRRSTRVYPLADDLARFQAQFGVSRKVARSFFRDRAEMLGRMAAKETQDQKPRRERADQLALKHNKRARPAEGNDPIILWLEDDLIVKQTEDAHDRLAASLDTMRHYGFARTSGVDGNVTTTGRSTLSADQPPRPQSPAAAEPTSMPGNSRPNDRTFDAIHELSWVECMKIALANSKMIGLARQGQDDPRLRVYSMQIDVNRHDLKTMVEAHVDDVTGAYWKLHSAYRSLDATKKGRDQSLRLWTEIKAKYDLRLPRGEAEYEAQSREQYFFFRQQVENALQSLYQAEGQLRYVMGLSPSDGRLLRPSDEPSQEKFTAEWDNLRQAALANAPDLIRQRRRVDQRKLDVRAASKLRPLAESTDRDARSADDGPRGRLGTDSRGKAQDRRELANLRNRQLQLARDQAVLQDMELELAHKLTDAYRSVCDRFAVQQTYSNRVKAATDEVRAIRSAFEGGCATLDRLLDAHRRYCAAEVAHAQSAVDYVIAVSKLRRLEGTLLAQQGIQIAGHIDQTEDEPAARESNEDG